MDELFLHTEKLKSGYNRFYYSFRDRVISDIVLKLEESPSDEDFDVLFHFKEPHLGMTEISNKSVGKIETAKSFTSRIEEYKKMHPFYLSVYKSLIYSCEYALDVYEKETGHSKKVKIIIDDFTLNYGGYTEVGAMVTLINALWYLLGFKPKNKLELRIPEIKQINNQECNFIHEVITNYVSWHKEINESETSHLFDCDKETFEKGRIFQWLV